MTAGRDGSAWQPAVMADEVTIPQPCRSNPSSLYYVSGTTKSTKCTV
jgi:hypothetical protein